MSESEPQGCLAAILRLFGFQFGKPGASSADVLPYRRNQFFLTDSEKSFLGVLKSVVPDHLLIALKPRLGDVLYVPRGTEGKRSHTNRINQKHLDFLLCDSRSLNPVLAIELDDQSHQRSDRQSRDEFVDSALKAADIPILHVRASRAYVPLEVKQQIESLLLAEIPPDTAVFDAADDETPTCPQCGTVMVRRVAKKSPRKGTAFWGCSNYPNCKGIVPLE